MSETDNAGATGTTTVTVDQPAVNDAATDAMPEPVNNDKASNAQPETIEAALEALKTANFRIAELNKENEKRRRREKELEREQQAQEEAQAKEQGEYQKLYQLEQGKVTERDAQIHTLTKRLIAAEMGLPESLQARLQGTTEEELRADAQELAKLVVKPKRDVPELDATRRSSGTPGVDPEQAKAAQSRVTISHF